MNSQEYWRKRALLAKQKEMASSTEYEVAMRSRLKDLENEFIRESKKWITKYAKENNQSLREVANYLNSIDTSKFDMTLAEFEAKARAGGFEKELNSAYYKTRIARLQELYKQYQELASRYADNEEDNMAIELAKRYEDTYLLENYNKYLVVGALNVNFTHFNEQELKNIVYQPWHGSNFSKRIWNNYTKIMPEVLTDVMFRSVALGYSLPQLPFLSICQLGVNLVLNGIIRQRIIITVHFGNLCKSLTVTNGVEAVLSFSFDFTSPHNLLISSREASSVLSKYTKLPQLPRIVSASCSPYTCFN